MHYSSFIFIKFAMLLSCSKSTLIYPVFHRLSSRLSLYSTLAALSTDNNAEPRNPGDSMRAIRREVRKKAIEEDRLEANDGLKVEYCFENRLRKIKPYNFTFVSFAKERHIGRTLPVIMEQEYPNRCSIDVVTKAILEGRITVNNQKISPDYKLMHGDRIKTLRIHRHEPPVPDTTIEVLHNSGSVAVIDKPHGIPVHPNGLYTYNSMMRILELSGKIPTNMHILNRLDGPASGIIILADDVAQHPMQRAMCRRELYKEYLAVVDGKFPTESVECTAPILMLKRLPLEIRIDPNGKPSRTVFRRVRYNPEDNTSLVQCILHTGRTHQIRIHLAHLQFPITNDRLYNPKFSGSPQVPLFLLQQQRQQKNQSSHIDNLANRLGPPSHSTLYTPIFPDKDTPCLACEQPPPDPTVEDLTIFLKAVLYRGQNWEYKAEWPLWAL
ncbi:uncharacterized protein VTP21DRAFT_3253 [Calcarisporiella thermophila]|uniref:uncharacterized protein n=1 Tax=Calcarisporiella thermophila TaxID=911321 RepID=UPI003743FE68